MTILNWLTDKHLQFFGNTVLKIEIVINDIIFIYLSILKVIGLPEIMNQPGQLWACKIFLIENKRLFFFFL